MGAGRDGFRDLLEMPVHGLGVCVGHDEPRACPTVRTDGAEQISPLVAGIAHGAGTAAAACPKPRQRTLLSNAGPILEPDLDRLGLGVLGKAVG